MEESRSSSAFTALETTLPLLRFPQERKTPTQRKGVRGAFDLFSTRCTRWRHVKYGKAFTSPMAGPRSDHLIGLTTTSSDVGHTSRERAHDRAVKFLRKGVYQQWYKTCSAAQARSVKKGKDDFNDKKGIKITNILLFKIKLISLRYFRPFYSKIAKVTIKI